MSTKICLNCLKEVEGDHRCSKCRAATYCGRECQVAHWPVHKNICLDSNREDSNEKLGMKAQNHLKQGNYTKAEKLYSKLLGILRSKVGDNDPDTLFAMNDLAVTYIHQGKYDQAEILLKQCYEKRRTVLGGDHPDTLNTMNNLASTYKAQGKYAQAEVLYKQ